MTDADRKLAKAQSGLDAGSLREIASIEDAIALLQSAGVEVKSASEELGDGFILLKESDKPSLVGTPFLVLDSQESEGDYGRTMITLRVITRDGRKLILNDGSTGIRTQVVEYLQDHDTIAGMAVERGLRASNYKYCNECQSVNRERAMMCRNCDSDNLTPAQTFYLDTARGA